jgi:lyso-ornithine lipid O-acyltransferase
MCALLLGISLNGCARKHFGGLGEHEQLAKSRDCSVLFAFAPSCPILRAPLSLWSFTKHFFGLALSVCAAGADALLRMSKTSHRERAEWLHRWCAFLLRRLSVDLRVVGPLPQHGLIVCNHLSYLDILVFSALAPCAFVSKSEVRRWPIFGLFAAIAGTIFVDRSKPYLAKQSVEEMQQTLDSGVRVVLFPEGTSTGGDRVLPFKPALFESAIETQQPVTAAHLRYELQESDPAQVACYWGDMTFVPHLLRLMREPNVVATVTFAESSQVFADRKIAAQVLHEKTSALASNLVAST